MCTIGYHKDQNVLFKVRDKVEHIREEMVNSEMFLACRTVGADYFSWGTNKNGCAFVSAAINSPEWTRLVTEGNHAGASELFRKENEGLENPMKWLSELLPLAESVGVWVKAVTESSRRWMGYNVIVADQHHAYWIELYDSGRHVKELVSNQAVTNHFENLAHGPQKEEHYPSSFRRFEMANRLIDRCGTVDDTIELPLNERGWGADAIWREGTFHTVSSSVIEFLKGHAFYRDNAGSGVQKHHLKNGFHAKSNLSVESPRYEMSRYIDLNLYHEVERSHPFYMEMTEEIINYITKRFGSEKPFRVLEIGSGTGLFTENLLDLENLDITALELDSECCRILETSLHGKPVRVINDSAVTFSDKEGYDFVVSTFAHDHIHYDKASEFVKNITDNLVKGGKYIMGGEILPWYTNESERKEALYKYHGFIVNKALRDRHFKVAQIEINALESGLDSIGDFKRHEQQFEQEMIQWGLSLEIKKKIGPDTPDDVGGVYVYVYSKD